MATININKFWTDKCKTALVGKTIKEVRYLTDVEQRHFGWNYKSLVIIFTDDTYIIPSSDDEGNQAGSLFTNIEGLEIIPVIQ